MRFSEPTCPLSRHGNQPSSRVDGLLGDGHFKSFLPRHVWNSFPRRVNDLGIKFHLCKKFTILQEFLLKLFKEALYLSLVLMSECHGQKDARRNVKRTRLTLSWAFSTFTCPSSMARG